MESYLEESFIQDEQQKYSSMIEKELPSLGHYNAYSRLHLHKVYVQVRAQCIAPLQISLTQLRTAISLDNRVLFN